MVKKSESKGWGEVSEVAIICSDYSKSWPGFRKNPHEVAESQVVEFEFESRVLCTDFFHGNLRGPPQCHSPQRNKALLRDY